MNDPGTIAILAGSPVLVAVVGWLQSRYATRATARQAAEVADLAEEAQTVEHLREEVEYFRGELARTRAERDERISAKVSRIVELEAEVDRSRAKGLAKLSEQARHCAAATADLVATIALLRGVVQDEIAQATADETTETAGRHAGGDHS